MVSNKYENLLRWIFLKTKLQDRFLKKDLTHWKINRGDIYACYFGENIGYEKSKLEARPCLLISTDEINHNSSNVIVAPLSKTIKFKNSNSKELKYSWHYVLYKKKYSKLNFNSCIQFEDIRSISKVRLGTYITHVEPDDMKNIKKRIKRALQA